ncbi:unnamed protein product [Arabis nemorensis]|uniref:SMAX1-like nucleotide binding domain-containing protein n=1 Tax=Arabis nemorensis TaxID=586526 RepID=A0A565CAX6_9BRAS|nr:unnamed protein product [Arabis nemorensis]
MMLKCNKSNSGLVNHKRKPEFGTAPRMVKMKNNKKRNTVIVIDSVSLTEGVVAKLMGRIERGGVPDDLKQSPFHQVSVFASWIGKGVVVLTDLNWAVWGGGNSPSSSNYSAADHVVEEIGL